MWCPFLHASPLGGSTLMTSAPKSERITAAPGAATKLEKSTTFSPEKMLSLAIVALLDRLLASASYELRGAFHEEGGRAFFLVFRCGAQPEVGGFQRKALALARIQSLVHGVERQLDGDRSVRGDHLQDGFRTRDQIGCRNDLVDEPDAMGFLR